MLVKDWMSGTVISIEASAPVSEAIDLLTKNIISMLPVVRKGRLVGVISDTDLKPYTSHPPGFTISTSEPSLLLSEIKVQDIMSKPAITVPTDYTVEETARVLSTNRISGVVVVDENNQIAGVMSQTDVNRVMVNVTGLQMGGIVFGLRLGEVQGSIKEITDIFRSYGGRIASILTSSERVAKGYRNVHIRIRGLDRRTLPQLKEELKKKAPLLYVVDSRQGAREIYETSAD
jgi:acetoin utilization protein AcuB